MQWFTRNRAAPTSPTERDNTYEQMFSAPGDDRGTDFETGGRMHARTDYDGHRLGASRLGRDQAVGDESGARRWIAGAIAARKGQRKATALQERLTAAQLVKALPGRLAANTAERTGVKERVRRWTKERLPEARAREKEAKEALQDMRVRFERLARHRKGYFHSPALLIGIELAVVAFDGGALYGALKHAGFSGAVLTFTMLSVPALVAATNHALGLAAGALGQKLTEDLRVKTTAAAFAATLLALLCAFILLVVFRGDATAAQNAALHEWASGKLTAAPAVLISPTWLGSAQIAGSFASILVVAFWSFAAEGREVGKEIGRLEQLVSRREAEREEVETEIEHGHERDIELVAHAAQLKAEAAEAQAAIDAHPELLEAHLESEDGLEEAAAGRLRTTFDFVSQIFANGRVMRVALPTVTTRFGRRITPAPGDAEGEPFREASLNGHKAMSDDELSSLIGD
ncbi:MAG TPA: hypothetical protein VL988_06330 [Solirubrobacteraceae bacterium]|nr:hypothetical protein [Solirubrobacteraceae bacterium]